MDYKDVFGERNYLDAMAIIEEPPLYAMITNAEMKIVDNQKTKTKDNKLILTLYGMKPEFIVNKTNFRTIMRVVGSKFTENWVGRVIHLIAAEEPRSPTGFAIRVVNEPEKVSEFLKSATSKEDLKERHRLLGERSNKELVLKIAKQWD